MGPFSYIRELYCTQCGQTYDPGYIQTYCRACNAPLFVTYNLAALKQAVDRDEIFHRAKGMWRWNELLPVSQSASIVSLGEGDTPILHLRRLGHQMGIANLFLKDESFNPTGSFKARGISAAVSKAVDLGIKKVVIPSAGNAGGALAAYSARAGLEALIYMPRNTLPANIIESKLPGATVELVDGLIDLAGKSAQEAEQLEGWFNMATFKEPYRVEGKKIMGYEIAERFRWQLPDKIIYPTGGGTGLVGMWKAFLELESLGWLESKTRPQLIAMQAEGCSPVVKAFKEGYDDCEIWAGAHTIATGLCVPKSFASRLMLQYIRDSHGNALSVSDADIYTSINLLANEEGIFACPEGAATLAGLRILISEGKVDKDETIVLFNTASGIKYLDSLR